MPEGPARLGLADVVRQAVTDLSRNGYQSRRQIDAWLDLIRSAAEAHIGQQGAIDAATRRALQKIYERLIDRGKVLDFVPGVGRYTLAMIRHDLRAELDRRILAAAGLIRLHRREAIEKTLRRFEGWSTAIPAGGEGAIDKREVRAHICKSARDFAYERRRVQIDQGHKLVANIADIVAVGNGAIAAEWHSRWREPGYDFRPDHKERDRRVYAIRDNWAAKAGLMIKGAGYMDEMTAPGEEPFCRCAARYILSPRQLPDAMLTRKGQEWIRNGGTQGRNAA